VTNVTDKHIFGNSIASRGKMCMNLAQLQWYMQNPNLHTYHQLAKLTNPPRWPRTDGG